MKKFMATSRNVIMLCLIFVFIVAGVLSISLLNLTVNADEIVYETKQYSNASIDDDYSEDSFIVILDKSISGVNKSQEILFEELNLDNVEELTLIKGDTKELKYLNTDSFHQIFKVNVDNGTKLKVLDIIEELKDVNGLLWVGPNYNLRPNGLPVAIEGSRFMELWGLKDGFGMQAQQAWGFTTGSQDIKVGVIDTGIYNHPDLAGNLVEGWDFFNDNSITTDDIVGHGTHVAGTIGATGKLSSGVVGVAPEVTLVPLQVVNTVTKKWAYSDIAKAISWATSHDIDIINCSGGGTDVDTVMSYAISNYTGLFVCSAGNDNENNDTILHYPSDYSRNQEFSDRVISVGNIDVNGDRDYNNSNYGAKSVSIYAPGNNILSTYPEYNETTKGFYAYYNGTSMAAPHVSGTAALLLAYDPTLTAEELKSIIIDSADYIQIDKGIVKKLNAYNAFKLLVNDADTDIFEINDLGNDQIEIAGLKVDYKGKLVIPNIYKGKIVTQIGSNAFEGQYGITEIVLPNTIKTISNAAFFNCVGLESVNFMTNSTLSKINGYAFQQCANLKSITIPGTVSNVSSGILSFAEQATVYTSYRSAPSNWNSRWNKADWVSIERPVVWGCSIANDTTGVYVRSFNKTSTSITKQNAINGISEPTRYGYIFDGWYNNSNFTGSSISAEDIASAPNNVTYYAKWVKAPTVTFDSNDFYNVKDVVSVKPGTTIDKPDYIPVREDCIFDYWALSTNLNAEYNWNSAVTDDIVLKAIWEPIGNKHVVTFDLDGGNGDFNPQVLVSDGATVSRPSNPEKTGYTLKHWALKGQTSAYNFSTKVTSDITLVAVWEKTKTYTVNFDTNGGLTSYSSIKVNEGSKIPHPIEPVKSSSRFKYWALSSNLNQAINFDNYYVYANVTFEAVWEDLSCTISFEGNGGTTTLPFLALNVGDYVSDFEEVLNENKPTRTGYTFRFWATSPNSSVAYDLDSPVTTSIRLYAIWKINTYTVTFDLDGGSGSFPNKTVNYGSTVSKPTNNPTKSGYTFKYWVLSGQTTEYDFSTPVKSNIKLIAIWSKNCVAAGTMITLADGSQKPVELLTGDEMLLVWNMYTGTFDSAPILCIDSDPLSMYEVIRLSFSDGTTVDVISEHGFFDVDLNKYVYLDEHAADYIGHCFLKHGANGMIQVTLEDVEVVQESTTAYSPVTYGHLCYFVNGMLSMPGGIDGLFNIFEVDPETMTYDAEAMAADIEKYGLYTYEELNALVPVPEVMFDAVNGQYLKVAVGKGIVTIEQIGELVERYADLFE